MKRMIVTVVYALPDAATQIEVSLPPGATAAEALERSGLARRFPEVDFRRLAVGIFGKRVERTQSLCDGDRLEVYRPLLADPKETRRRRAGRPAKR